ncbi:MULTISPECIES: hypothetical protein [unclassified Caballeronia]|uniref:hypothetical protein n=1 Tax=unclassified Caballeronia TaxID=2646786 RepID=UPI0020289F4A|nr:MULTISPECIES: hypothetical protein [unclassified Caballeronia]MDR5765909.1 hypothetical protein [Caballeronia sp. LZ028]
MITRTEKQLTFRDVWSHSSFRGPLWGTQFRRVHAKCTDDGYVIQTVDAQGNAMFRELKRAEFGLVPGSILELAIKLSPQEVDSETFHAFNIVFRVISKSPKGQEILSSPPESISASKIQSLLLLANRNYSGKPESKIITLKGFASFISYCPRLIRGGKKIAEIAAFFFAKFKLPIGDNYVEITTTAMVHGVRTEYLKIIDFDALGLKSGGLLSEALSGAPEIIQHSSFYQVIAVLRKLVKTTDGKRLLSTPAAELEVEDVSNLFSLVDTLLPNKKSRNSLYTSFKVFTSYSLARLKNGQNFCDAAHGYRVTPFVANRDDAPASHNVLDSLKVISASSDVDFYEKATSKLRSLMDTYLIACEQVLNDHGECIEKMNAILALGPPKTLPKRIFERYTDGIIPVYDTMKRLPQDAVNWLLMSYVHNEQMYVTGTANERGFGLSHFLTGYGLQATAGYAFDVALSQFYLTQRSLIACFIILAIKTGWNGSTLVSLNSGRIRRIGTGYRLTGIKTKTDQFQQIEIEEVEWRADDKLSCRAIELLIWHNRNIDAFLERRNPSIFCALRLRYDGRRIAHLPQISRYLQIFLESNNLPHITIRDYRTLRLNYTYVEGGGDIIATQVQAGHSSMATTVRYLRLKVQTELHDANIRRYMRVLGKSILWVTGNKEIDDSEESKAAKRLLFPASPYASENRDSVADSWIASGGEMRVEITEDDAIHCCLQQRFYEQRLSFLISFNEKRFLAFHLPRIVFCAALYRLLRRSPFAYVLRETLKR